MFIYHGYNGDAIALQSAVVPVIRVSPSLTVGMIQWVQVSPRCERFLSGFVVKQ